MRIEKIIVKEDIVWRDYIVKSGTIIKILYKSSNLSDTDVTFTYNQKSYKIGKLIIMSPYADGISKDDTTTCIIIKARNQNK